MQILLSPAKALNLENIPQIETTNCIFLDKSDYLIQKLKKFSSKKIGLLMGLSPELANLNHGRFQEWELDRIVSCGTPAIYAFNGEAYRGLAARELNDGAMGYLQKSLWMLSGLYGMLRPADLILPYRLEMGTRLSITPKISNLYQFWTKSITEQIQKALDGDDNILINLASSEYAKSVRFKDLKGKVITCHFKEEKNNQYKVVMVYAKQARGRMVRFMADNKIDKIEDLKSFDCDGYSFSNNLSTSTDFVFTRSFAN